MMHPPLPVKHHEIGVHGISLCNRWLQGRKGYSKKIPQELRAPNSRRNPCLAHSEWAANGLACQPPNPFPIFKDNYPKGKPADGKLALGVSDLGAPVTQEIHLMGARSGNETGRTFMSIYVWEHVQATYK